MCRSDHNKLIDTLTETFGSALWLLTSEVLVTMYIIAGFEVLCKLNKNSLYKTQ